MWVPSYNSDSVVELSLTGATVGTFNVGAQPRGIAWDGTHMWVGTNSSTVVKL
jgi:hypothetical protein